MNIRSLFWLLPFLSFLAGYWLMARYYKTETIQTPHLIGKPLQEAFGILSNLNITPRLMAEKEDTDLAPGIVLNQTPAPGQKIKPYQTVMVVVSKKPSVIVMPTLVGKSKQEIDTIAKELGLHHKSYVMASNHPKDYCFAQWPQPGTPLEQKTMISYCCTGESKPIIFPDLKNMLLSEVLEFLQPFSIKTEVIHRYQHHEPHKCTTCKVVDQRPLAGSIITMDKATSLHVQLQVQ